MLVGRAGRVWSHTVAEHICIYTWGDSKKFEGLKGEKQTIKGRKSTGLRRKPLDKPDSGFYNQSKLVQRDSLLI